MFRRRKACTYVFQQSNADRFLGRIARITQENLDALCVRLFETSLKLAKTVEPIEILFGETAGAWCPGETIDLRAPEIAMRSFSSITVAILSPTDSSVKLQRAKINYGIRA